MPLAATLLRRPHDRGRDGLRAWRFELQLGVASITSLGVALIAGQLVTTQVMTDGLVARDAPARRERRAFDRVRLRGGAAARGPARGAFVIAEGIESEAIPAFVRHAHALDAVRDLSIEGGQGYLLGRPALAREPVPLIA